MGLLCVNAAKEYYDCMKLNIKSRNNLNLMLLVSILVMEIALVVTQGKGMTSYM